MVLALAGDSTMTRFFAMGRDAVRGEVYLNMKKLPRGKESHEIFSEANLFEER
jgi:hypothetical protein